MAQAKIQMPITIVATPIKRRVPSKAEIIEILLRQGADLQGFVPPRAATSEAKLFALILAHVGRVPCGNFSVCGHWITSKAGCRRDHTIPLRQIQPESRAAFDTPCNQRYLCLDCDKSKTFRRGHNSAGLSDATLNAKIRRQEKRVAGGSPCATKKRSGSWSKPCKPWPKGRKLQSRPFPLQQRRLGSPRRP